MNASVFERSRAYREEALRYLPFGVSSTPRGRQKPVPVVIEDAQGVHLTDIDGNRYIDLTLGYGPLILGHTPDCVTEAVTHEMARGLRTATVHRGEAALAALLSECVPSAKLTAFVNSGTEAVQLALRIARASTGRLKVAKFRANYHGWIDSLHVGGALGQDGPLTIGQDPLASADVVLLDWGHSEQVSNVLDESFAAVILEPAAVNPGCFEPPPGFLETLRTVTRRLGIVLIFDEVITGFRLGLGGAQERYGVIPDLTVLGKVLGGGLPIGAVCGGDDIMRDIASGRLLHRGTFNGNPLSMAAGLACVRSLREQAETLYPRLEGMAIELESHINSEAERLGVKVCAQHIGSAVQIFAGLSHISGINDLHSVDRQMIMHITESLLEQGVYTLPRGLMYLGAPHDSEDIAAVLVALTNAMETLSADLMSRQP